MLETKVVKEKTDLTYLKWSHIRSSSGTAGTFLKSESELEGRKRYYKLSNFDPVNGVVGHECVNEIIADRLLSILEIPHLHYELINAVIEVEGREYETYLNCSEDFKNVGESKTALGNFYLVNADKGESHYDFCIRMGWKDYIDTMIAFDFLILNRDRHGANIEVLRNARAHTLRLAPLFDHGLSLMYSCTTDEEVMKYDILEDKKCQNFIGGFSCFENLSLIGECVDKRKMFKNILKETDKEIVFKDLDGILSPIFINRIWDMIYTRYRILEGNMYENL